VFYEPTPHQVEDSDALLEYADGYLWADAGTGKTVTAMEAIRKGGYEKVLVLCPKIAITMWCEELSKHMKGYSKLGNDDYLVRGFHTGRLTRDKGIHFFDAWVMPFGVARNFMKKHETAGLFQQFQTGGNIRRNPNAKEKWEDRYKTLLIIDEAHNLKSVSAQQTKAVFGSAFDGDFPSIMYGMNSVYQLTGTPVMRYFDDLYSQLRPSRYEILKHYGVETHRKFVDKFCRTKLKRFGSGPAKRVVVGNTNHALMTKMLDDCKVIRRKLDDVVDNMPTITHRVIDTDYRDVPKGGISGMSSTELLAALASEDTEAAKIRRQLGIAKAASIVDYVEKFAMRPTLIGFWHRDACEAMHDLLSVFYDNIAVVNGSTPTSARNLIRDDFNAGKIPLILGQMQAMNSSWNLQEACKHVIIAEEVPSPALLHQFYSRVYRRGQKQHVQVDYMLSDHPLDIALRNIRLTKQADNEKVGL
jgi:SNF2 family DNA or RNA helicase